MRRIPIAVHGPGWLSRANARRWWLSPTPPCAIPCTPALWSSTFNRRCNGA